MDRKDIDYIFKYVMLIAGGWLLLSNAKEVLRAVSALVGAASPLFVGVFIAYMVDAPAGFIRSRLFQGKPATPLSRKAQNAVPIILAYLLFLGLAGFLLFVFLPSVFRSLYSFASDLPGILKSAQAKISDSLGAPMPELALALQSVSDSLSGSLQSVLSSIGSGAAVAIGGIWQTASTLLFGLVFSVYILFNRQRIKELGGKVLILLFGEPLRTTVARLLQKFHTTFRKYIFGQMTDALILGVLCFLGMLILGLPYAAGISLVVALMSLIPVAGTFIGVAISSLVLLTGNPWDSLVFLVFVLILQQVENNLIYPKIVGDALGIDGMFVFAGVVVGAGLWGIKGMVLGVPITAFLYSLLSDFFAIRKRRREFSN